MDLTRSSLAAIALCAITGCAPHGQPQPASPSLPSSPPELTPPSSNPTPPKTDPSVPPASPTQPSPGPEPKS